jgi:hypothetical protein
LILAPNLWTPPATDPAVSRPAFFAAFRIAFDTTAADLLTIAPNIAAAATLAKRRADFRSKVVSGAQ